MSYRPTGAGRFARALRAHISTTQTYRSIVAVAGLAAVTAGLAIAIDYQMYPSAFPAEHYDSLGTSTAASGGLTNPASVLTTSVRNFQDTFSFLTRDPSELYLLGGIALPTTNYIAKVDPKTMAEIKRTSLDCPRPACPYNQVWAPSGAVHANGFIYVVAESRVWRLDKDLNVIGFYTLPILDGAYNTLKILSDGNIVVKGLGNAGGADDYSGITILTPDLQAVVANYVLPNKVYGRISTLLRNGKEHIYVTGETRVYRLWYDTRNVPALQEDTSWSFTYRSASDTATSAGGLATFIGNEAFFADNCVPPTPPTGPLHLIRVNLDDSADAQIMTAFPGTSRGYRFNKHLVDPVNNVIVVGDSENGLMAGYRYLGNGNYTKLWQQSLTSRVIMTASASTRQLYVTDYNRGNEDVVILDTVTGQILKRVSTGSNMPSVSVISVGFNKDIFYCNGSRLAVRIYNQ